MVTPPKLIGLVVLPFPRVRVRKGEQPTEYIDRVAFDTDGGAWGLVMSRTPIVMTAAERREQGYGDEDDVPDVQIGQAYRINFVRWVRFEAIPFSAMEVVTADGWETAS